MFMNIRKSRLEVEANVSVITKKISLVITLLPLGYSCHTYQGFLGKVLNVEEIKKMIFNCCITLPSIESIVKLDNV